MSSLWSVSTEHGSNLSADALVGLLASHHKRLLDSWQGFSPSQWEHPSRNPLWSVHHTARHVADAMEAGTADVLGVPTPFSIIDFDPRTTPETWMAASASDPPARTIERFAEAAARLRLHVGERVAGGDASMGATVYGPAHWSVMVVHLFWDSWLHERDVLLPLGISAESTHDEQRLAALYGLMMTMVPARMMEQPFKTAIEFTGPAGHTVGAGHESGRVWSHETLTAQPDLTGELCSVVDSLSGRGAPLNEVLPNAPDMLSVFANFMVS